MQDQSTITNDSISLLNKNIEKSISFRRNFFLSIVKGVGSFLGATIVAGILLGILSTVIDSVDDVPVLNKIVSTIEDSTVNNSN